jgi:hypothetical protein
MKNFRFGEVSCPTKYFEEASSINVSRSIVYGVGVLKTGVKYRLHKWGVLRCALFAEPAASEPLPIREVPLGTGPGEAAAYSLVERR